MTKPRVATSVLLLALLLCASALGEAPLETVQRQLNPENTDSTVRGATELLPTEPKHTLDDGFRKIDKRINVEDGVDGDDKTKKLQRKRIATAIRGRKTASSMVDNIFIPRHGIVVHSKSGKKGGERRKRKKRKERKERKESNSKNQVQKIHQVTNTNTDTKPNTKTNTKTNKRPYKLHIHVLSVSVLSQSLPQETFDRNGPRSVGRKIIGII